MTEVELELVKELIASNMEIAKSITLVGKDLQRFHNSSAEHLETISKQLRHIEESMRHLR